MKFQSGCIFPRSPYELEANSTVELAQLSRCHLALRTMQDEETTLLEKRTKCGPQFTLSETYQRRGCGDKRGKRSPSCFNVWFLWRSTIEILFVVVLSCFRVNYENSLNETTNITVGVSGALTQNTATSNPNVNFHLKDAHLINATEAAIILSN